MENSTIYRSAETSDDCFKTVAFFVCGLLAAALSIAAVINYWTPLSQTYSQVLFALSFKGSAPAIPCLGAFAIMTRVLWVHCMETDSKRVITIWEDLLWLAAYLTFTHATFRGFGLWTELSIYTMAIVIALILVSTAVGGFMVFECFFSGDKRIPRMCAIGMFLVGVMITFDVLFGTSDAVFIGAVIVSALFIAIQRRLLR